MESRCGQAVPCVALDQAFRDSSEGREVLGHPFHRPRESLALQSLPVRTKKDWFALCCRLGKLGQGEPGARASPAASRFHVRMRLQHSPCCCSWHWKGTIATSAGSLNHRRSRAWCIQQSTDPPGCTGTCREDPCSFPLLQLFFPLQYAPWSSEELAEALLWIL